MWGKEGGVIIMYVCVYICNTYDCICVYVCVFMYNMFMYVDMYVCVYRYVGIYFKMYVYIYIFIFVIRNIIRMNGILKNTMICVLGCRRKRVEGVVRG